MSVFPSIANLFRPTTQVTVAPPINGNPMQPVPVVPGAGMPQNNPGADPNNPQHQLQQPQQGQQQQPQQVAPTTPPSPLDEFAKVWDTDPAKTPPVNPWDAPLLPGADAGKIQAAAKNVDMMAGVPQELVQKVLAGGDAQALIQLINAVGQNTLAMSAQLSSASVERAGSEIRNRTVATLPNAIRDARLDEMQPENPVLAHSGAQGLLKLARQQLKMQNPSWSAEQVNSRAEQYLMGFAQAATAAPPSQPGQRPVDPATGQPEQDWSKFLDG